jgi:hypothetical protein
MFSLPEKQSFSRISAWQNFRGQLETSIDPFVQTSNFFQSKKKIKFYTDPYDQSTWPTPWELIEENEYCPFNIILGICYTLQLTERFKNIEPTISICIDNDNKTVYYLLLIDDKVYGYKEDEWISALLVPKTLKTIKIYNMTRLH